MIKKKLYTTQFKKEVVRLSFECNSIKDLSVEMNVSVQYIYEWRKQFINEVLGKVSSGKGVELKDPYTHKHYKTIYVKGHVSDF